MASDRGSSPLRVDRDGVRIIEAAGVRKAVWLLVLALGLLIVAMIVVVRPLLNAGSGDVARGAARPTPSARAPSAHAANGAVGAAVGPRVAQQPAVTPWRPVPAAHVEPPAAVHDTEPTPSGEDAATAAPMFEAGAPGEGIAVFPPPGTKPIKRGIIVPEEFELPPGYVRHYQAIDDGRRVPAILMFHPDYQPLDERGQPIPLPASRVVPPEMAPPGLSIQMLELPEEQGGQEP